MLVNVSFFTNRTTHRHFGLLLALDDVPTVPLRTDLLLEASGNSVLLIKC